jgi:hypothetical protein
MKAPTTGLTLFLLLATTVIVRSQEVVSNRLVDIGFVFDVSRTFQDDIAKFKVEAKRIVDTVTGMYPNAYFGLVTFQDFPLTTWGEPGDSPHTRVHDLGRPDATFLASVNGLSAGGGGEFFYRSQLVALNQSITGSGLVVPPVEGVHDGYEIPPGQNFHFRSGSARIIILWTDSNFRTPDNTNYYPVPYSVDVYTATRIGTFGIGGDAVRIVGLWSRGARVEAVEWLARWTGGVAGPAGVDCYGEGIVTISIGEPIYCWVESGLTEAIAGVIAGIVPEIQPPLPPRLFPPGRPSCPPPIRRHHPATVPSSRRPWHHPRVRRWRRRRTRPNRLWCFLP